MKYVIQYGKQVDVTKLDEEGSIVTEEKTIMDFKEVDNKQRFEIRVKVHDDKEELSEYLQFRTDTKDMANAEFRIEHTAIGNKQGFYYVIKCYTVRK